MKKELAFCKTLLTMMFACSLLLTSCGKDEIAPEPTPTPTPTPTPEKTYSGFAFFFTLDSCYGSKEDTTKFRQMVTESIKKIYPEAKAEGDTISAHFVSQNKDSINALYIQWNKLVKSELLKMKDLDQPVVTAKINHAAIQKDDVRADWKANIGMTVITPTTPQLGTISTDISRILIPGIANSIFSTGDSKDQPIEKISFFSKGWSLKKGDPTIFSMEVVKVINTNKITSLNDTTSFYATRLGAELFLYKNKDAKSSYDFQVCPENKLKLVKVDGSSLAEDKQPVYALEPNIKQ